jgi:hypothetical protein
LIATLCHGGKFVVAAFLPKEFPNYDCSVFHLSKNRCTQLHFTLWYYQQQENKSICLFSVAQHFLANALTPRLRMPRHEPVPTFFPRQR